MFYISLPYFHENYKFNLFFKEYIENNRSNRQNKLIADFNIEYVYGSFPWSYWNGGINNHKGQAILSNDIHNFFNRINIPIRIDASNIYINESNYYDIHENTILKIANGTNTSYEISDLNLMSYIAKYNLNNKFIISNNAQLLYAFDSNILNIFQKYQEIELINIGYNPFEQLKDIDFSQIQNKNKLEISIGHCQNCSLDKYLECSKSEQKNIYNFSKLSLFTNCQNECKNFNYYNDIKPYLKQGIKHFKIISKPNNLTEFNINIIRSFVKPEYQGECINEYLQRISK